MPLFYYLCLDCGETSEILITASDDHHNVNPVEEEDRSAVPEVIDRLP